MRLASVEGGSSEFIESLSVTIRRRRRNRRRNHDLSSIAMKCGCHIVHVAFSFEIVERVCVDNGHNMHNMTTAHGNMKFMKL